MAKTPLVHFGQGKLAVLPKLISQFGTHVLILTGKRSFTQTAAWNQLQETLTDQKIAFSQATIPGEPSPSMVDGIVHQYKQQVDCVVAIGGGSVMDAGKAVSAMACHPEGVKNYLEGVGTQQPMGKKLPFIAVPTTAGTGSEATKNAVISEVGIHGFKKSLRHDSYVPNIAVIDPEIMQGAPPSVTAASGMDAFTQLLEAYLSTKANSFTDAIAQKGLKHIQLGLVPAWEVGDNIDARSHMALAGYYSGIALANAGLGLVHGFASSVGAKIPIPHGILCGSLMGITNRISLKKISHSHHPETYKKYAWAGRLFSKSKDKTDAFYAEALISTIERWTEDFDFPSLSTFGLRAKHIPPICQQTGQKNHPVSFSPEEIEGILYARL